MQRRKAKKVKEEEVPSKWKAELQLATDKTDSRKEEVKTRLQNETTGFVPSLQRPESDGLGETMDQNTPLSASDIKIMTMEKRLAELEGRVTAESRWARSMGAFLYDANQKTLETMEDVLGGFGAVKGMVEKAMGKQ